MKYRLEQEGILTASEDVFIRHALSILCRHYPGWDWCVEVKGGIVSITCRNLLTQYGMRNRIERCSDQAILWAGGELLERFKQPRGSINRHSIPDVERTVRGHLRPEL